MTALRLLSVREQKSELEIVHMECDVFGMAIHIDVTNLGFLVLDTKGTSVGLVRQGRCHYSRRVITDSY